MRFFEYQLRFGTTEFGNPADTAAEVSYPNFIRDGPVICQAVRSLGRSV